MSRVKLGEFSRNVLVILTGSVASQAIGILASPVLTRLYTPAEFGVNALFVSITALLGSVICGRYEYGITLPEKDRDALALLGVCVWVAFGFAVLLVPVTALFGGALVGALKQPQLQPWLWFIPAAMFVTGVGGAARYWLLRTKAFRVVSVNGVLRSALTAVFAITCGVFGWKEWGLTGALLAGLLVSAGFLVARIWRVSGSEIRTLRWPELRAQAVAQRRFPMYSLGSAVVEAGAGQVPAFLLSTLFGSSSLGWFALAQRIANLPLTLVAQSVGDVFRQQASEVYAREGNCLRLFDRTLRRLLTVSLPVFAVAAWVSPWVFGKVFGAEWVESGRYVRYLTPAMALRFVSSPLSSMFYIAHRQAADLGVQVLLIAAMVLVFVWAGRPGSDWVARHAVIAYSVVYSVKYLVELYFSRRFACGSLAK